MKATYKNTLNFISVLFLIILVTKAISSALYWYLPKEGVSLDKTNDITPSYVRIDFSNMISKIKQKIAQKITEENSQTINDLVLIGLYGNDKKGYVIIAPKSNPKKTSIISIGETYQGYKLKAIRLKYAIFTRNSKDYKLQLQKTKTKQSNVKITNYNDKYTNLKTVNKKDISYFATNPREIWKNISIKEVYNGKKIDGFKVMWIKPGSKFAQLGLKKGDIIIKANNKRLTSYKDAIDIYTNISRLKEVQITVLRDNDEKEFIYEIN